jgi:hypothetical protein
MKVKGRRRESRGFPRRGGLRRAGPRRAGWAPWLVALGLGLAGAATAANDVTRPAETADAVLNAENQSWNRYLHDALRLPSWLDLAIEQRTRFELLEDPFRPGEPDTQTQFPLRTRLRVGVDGPGPLRFLVEIQDSRTYSDGPLDYTDTEIDKIDVLQLFVSATARDLLGSGLRADLHVGRMTLDVASRRLVARNRFRNTTNSFDGIHLQLGDGEAWRVRAFFTWPVVREENYMDDNVSWKKKFWGVAYEDKRIAWLNLDAYYLGLRDKQSDLEHHTFGLRGVRPQQAKQVDYELELMGQFGDTNGLDFSAVGAHAEVGYTLDLPWSPRLAGVFDYASGTSNPDGNESHTFDYLFGARRWDLDVTGIFGPFRRSNILSPGATLIVSPIPKVKLTTRFRYWELAKARDKFVGTGLQDPTGAAGRHLGEDVEMYVKWLPTPWLELQTGWDHWFKGSYLHRVPNVPSTKDADFFYAMAKLRL